VYRPEEIREILLNRDLRWGDDRYGITIAQRLLRKISNHSLQERFDRRYKKKLRNFLSSGDPFFGNYPFPGELPPMAKGRIPLCALPTRDVFSMPSIALKQNKILVGASGMGKTNCLKGTIRGALESGATVIAFDRKGKCELADAAILLGSKFPINVWKWEELKLAPLQPIENVSIKYWGNLITSLLGSSWSLISSTTLLAEIVHEFFSGGVWTWSRLVEKAVSFEKESLRSEQYRDVIVRNLKSVLYGFGDVINAAESNAIDVMTQTKGLHVITTDGLTPEHASLLSAFFIVRDYENRRVNERLQDNLACYVLDDSMAIIREAGSFKSEGFTINPISTISFMGRSLGMGLIVSAQNFSQVSGFFRNNCNTIVACNSTGEDCYQLGRHMNLNEEQTRAISILRPGEVIVQAKSVWPLAVWGKYPLFE
jgi:hypothetical protein